MTAIEKLGFCGLIGGAIAGGVIGHSHGMLALAGGVIGGGIAGLILGVLSIYPLCAIGATVFVLRQVQLGKLKFPKESSTTPAQRRKVLMLITAIFAVTVVVWAGLYVVSSEVVRSRLLAVVLPMVATFVIGVLFLIVQYRRYPARREDRPE